jgi:hypothetical protein
LLFIFGTGRISRLYWDVERQATESTSQTEFLPKNFLWQASAGKHPLLPTRDIAAALQPGTSYAFKLSAKLPISYRAHPDAGTADRDRAVG